MSIACMMITTNLKNRLHLLESTVLSIERKVPGLFDYKIMSVDLFPNGIHISHFNKYKILGWAIVSGPCSGKRGMINNQKRGLQNMNTDFVFYAEDDIIIDKIPTKKEWEEISQHTTKNGKKIGFICYNTHIHDDPNNPPKEKVMYINCKANFIRVCNNLFLMKSPVLKDNYYLNFPVAILPVQVFHEMHKYADDNYRGMGIEVAMTHAWFELHKDKEYDAVIYVKNDTLDRLPLNLNRFYRTANMQFWNNNPNLRHKSISRQNTIF